MDHPMSSESQIEYYVCIAPRLPFALVMGELLQCMVNIKVYVSLASGGMQLFPFVFQILLLSGLCEVV